MTMSDYMEDKIGRMLNRNEMREQLRSLLAEHGMADVSDEVIEDALALTHNQDALAAGAKLLDRATELMQQPLWQSFNADEVVVSAFMQLGLASLEGGPPHPPSMETMVAAKYMGALMLAWLERG